MGKRNKRKALHRVECTCPLRYEIDVPRHVDHESDCELWLLDDFANGILDWDPVSQRLEVMYGVGERWDDDVPSGEATDLQKIIDATVGGLDAWSHYWKGGSNYVSCRHNMTEVVLPDGTLVHCSASTDVRGRVNRPDYGVYLHNGWTAQSIATFVPWQDYGTPLVPWAAAREIVEEFYRRAKRGERVEVGCMGGHGRTGTFLAAVVLLADPNMTPKGAVEWVRANYCFKAVEDESQEYWLEWFADPSLPAFYNRPKPSKPVASGTSCNRQKRGKWCRKDDGHDGPHHYTLPARRTVEAEPYTAPDGDRCVHLLTGGDYRCRFKAGHSGYHAYTKWTPADAPCDKGLTGPCSMSAGHTGACVVKVRSGVVDVTL